MAADLITLGASTLTFAAPLILAALGGLCSERSGIINIGLEGKMLGAACATGMVGQASGNAALGLAAGLITAILLSLAHWMFTQNFRMDHIVSGMAINALSAGGTSLIAKTRGADFAGREMAALPVFAFWILAFTAVVAVWYILRGTRPGLRLLAVGNDPDKSRQMGVVPERVRFSALIATGLMTGLAGALIVSNAGGFTDGMTSGRGYIGLAALILGGYHAFPVLAACLFFAFLQALQIQFQGTDGFAAAVPVEFWQALPFIATLVALALFGKSRAPSGLGQT